LVDLSKVLITGCQGMIGQEVSFGVKISHQELDVTNKYDIKKYIRPVIVLFFILVIISSFIGYNTMPSNTSLFKMIDDKDYAAIKFIEKEDSSDSVVISESYVSSTIFAISNPNLA
jgi:hypothetical protein